MARKAYFGVQQPEINYPIRPVGASATAYFAKLGQKRTMTSKLDELRAFHAKLMASAANSDDPRLERVFELVPREAFLPPAPWKIMVNSRYHATPSDDPAYIYQNNLVALDAAKGINNGEPFLHAAWIGATNPRPGERICHVGAGTGFYTAILSVLASPGGGVEAFEVDEALSNAARQNLEPYEGVSVTHGDATQVNLPSADLIYVNAGVLAPPQSWLKALRPGGRMIFPWRPADNVGLAMLITRTGQGDFEAKPLMTAWFIPCVGGASTNDAFGTPPDSRAAWSVQSVWLTSQRAPDETAVAKYEHVWFSSAAGA
jgi:protein-L-isoaspartate(D-aspartate) O-methyltransferase